MTIGFSTSQLVASGFCKVIILFVNFRYSPPFFALYGTDLQCTDGCLGVTRFCGRIEQITGPHLNVVNPNLMLTAIH